jgi:hypothetical protein
MRICPSWLNLLHNRNPHLETLGGSVSFQCGINIFPLFIYKLHQQYMAPEYLTHGQIVKSLNLRTSNEFK